MKRLRIIGLALLALLALSAFAASMASAEEGLLPNSTSSGSGKGTTLETTAKEKISCTAVSIKEAAFNGTSDQAGKAKLEFTGCKAEGLVPVNSLGDAKEVILSAIAFLVCLVEPTKLVFGLLIQPVETEHIEVPATKELILVKGAVIAELESPTLLKGKEFSYKLAGKAGVQTTATKCVILGKEFKHTFESANDKKATDLAASEEGLFTLKFEKEVELMDS